MASEMTVTLPSPERLDGWFAAGEYRVTLDGWRDLLVRASVGHESDSLFQRLEAARYGDASVDDVRDLCAEARAAFDELGEAV